MGYSAVKQILVASNMLSLSFDARRRSFPGCFRDFEVTGFARFRGFGLESLQIEKQDFGDFLGLSEVILSL
jgi:hypothetical protein